MTFTFKQFQVNQDRCAMKIGTDGVLLGAWTPLINNPFNVLDIGAGTGILSLMLAQRSNAAPNNVGIIDAIEIDEDAYEQCVENFEASPWGDKLFCFHAGLDEFVDEPEDEYDLIISNPPFYTDDFNQLSYIAKETTAKQILHKLLQKNIPLILATNPLFPLKAVHSRLSWGKLHDIPFKLITSYETSHFCKPNIEYYQEIVEKLGCSPSECLMIGNDVKEDLITADYSGSLLDLHSHIDSILA